MLIQVITDMDEAQIHGGRILMRQRSTVLAVLLTAIAVAGCDRTATGASEPADDPPFTVRDSAGIEIVENHAPEYAVGQFWTFDSEPEYVLGGSEGLAAQANDSAQLIWSVVGLARLPDGRVAVLSSENKQILLFEPSGELSRTIGRAGEGPGEFTRPEWLQYLPPDTLVVWDYFLTSIAYFDTAGTLLRERSVDHARLRETGASGEAFLLPLRDGSFVVTLSGGPDSETTEIKGWDPRTSSLLTFQSRVRAFARIDDGYGANVLGPSADITAGGKPPAIYLSSRGRNEIRQFSLDGVLLRIIRRTTDPIPVTQRAHRNILERAYRSWEAGGSNAPRDIIAQMYEKEEAHPPIAELVVDAEGYLWVREWSDSESGIADRWSVFNADGRWLGVLPFPWDPGPTESNSCGGNNTVLCWVDRDLFLAVRQDELGVERVEGYRIRRGGPAVRG